MNATAAAMADAVRIRLVQGGHAVAASEVDPAHALLIRWSPFGKGRADPNGISDDLIFVHVGDCHGRILERTPPPFLGKRRSLIGAPRIPCSAGMLGPGSIYQISVEQAPVVTSRTEGVPTFATYPATTYLDSKHGQERCPMPRSALSNGSWTKRPEARSVMLLWG